MAWTCFEIAINLFQAILMVYFIRRKLHLIHREMRYAVGSILAIASVLSLYLFVEVPFTDTIVFLLPMAYGFWVSDDPWHIKVFWGIVLAVAFIATVQAMASLIMLLPNASWDMILQDTPLHISYVIGTNLALFIVIFVLSRKRQEYSTLSLGAMLVFVVLEILYLLIIELSYVISLANPEWDMLFALLSSCSLLCAFMSLVLYTIMGTLSEKKQKYEVEIETLRLTHHHANEMKEMYTYMVGQQHDLKKQIEILRCMIGAGYSEESQEFMQQISSKQTVPLAFTTGSIAVDALLTSKKLTMDKQGIHFVFQPYPLHELPLSESDFCAVLSNLLDNAIEAIERTIPSNERSTIKLTLVRSWNIFFITCQNPAAPVAFRRVGDIFVTSKKNAFLHGHGMRNVRNIVEHINGIFECTCKGNVFLAKVILPFKDKE